MAEEVEYRECKRCPKFIIGSNGEIISHTGRTVGNASVNGYNTICVYDEVNKRVVNYYTHILVFETFNELPTPNGLYSKEGLHNAGYERHYIEHIDGDKANNAVSNLRLSDVKRPTFKHNRDLPMGVQRIAKLRTTKKFENVQQAYKATIQINRKKYHLGTFSTVEEAEDAYRTAYFNYYRTMPPTDDVATE